MVSERVTHLRPDEEMWVVAGRNVFHFPENLEVGLAVALCHIRGQQSVMAAPLRELEGKRPCRRCARMLA